MMTILLSFVYLEGGVFVFAWEMTKVLYFVWKVAKVLVDNARMMAFGKVPLVEAVVALVVPAMSLVMATSLELALCFTGKFVLMVI